MSQVYLTKQLCLHVSEVGVIWLELELRIKAY